jgi:predicted kinase
MLVLMCGLPFAGKSTVARRIAAATGWTHLETDAVARDLGFVLDERPLPRSQWAATYRESYRRLDLLLGGGASVVYDATNFRRLMRDRLRMVAQPYGAQVVVTVVAATAEEIARRRAANLAAPARPHVLEADFAEVLARFQWPGPDEPYLVWDDQLPFPAWLDRLHAALAVT